MDTFNIIAGICSIIGLAGSIVGFFSWFSEREKRRKLEMEAKRKVWSDISKVTGLMSDLEKDLADKGSRNGVLQAVGKLSFMLRDLLKEVSLLEKQFTLKDIIQWRNIGKLASDWQEKIALMLLSTDEIDDELLDEEFKKFRDWDALPETSPAYAQNFDSRKNKE